METIANLDKFVELDIVKKISNLINPYLETYAFNYKENVYLYRCWWKAFINMMIGFGKTKFVMNWIMT
jgi:hypothetical protein